MSNEEQITQRYLLGEMTEAEREALEREYFNDPQLFDRMVQAESELVDNYARGLLAPPVRDRFEQYYLVHFERRERAKFAATLATRVDRVSEVAPAPSARTESLWNRWLASMRRPVLAWAFSAALLLMAAVTVWYLFQTRRAQQELARTEAERTTQERRGRESQQQVAPASPSEKLPDEVERPRVEQQTVPPVPTPPLKAAPAFASLTLTVNGTRGADTALPVLVIPRETEQVRLRLNLEESDYMRYQATLQTADGEEIFTRRRLTPRNIKSGARLVLIIPARRFAAGDYILTLRGVSKAGEVEDVSKSLFSVERK